LQREYDALISQLETRDLSDEQVEQIESFCAEIREGLENGTFEDKQRYLGLLHIKAHWPTKMVKGWFTPHADLESNGLC
jgi:hypothetical protein